jgi:hypothetical protein
MGVPIALAKRTDSTKQTLNDKNFSSNHLKKTAPSYAVQEHQRLSYYPQLDYNKFTNPASVF